MDDPKETNRLEAFSDGVFAVAITLLVLNIRIPGLNLPANQLPGEGDLGKMLLSEWPMFVAYITSFATIGIMWLNHHRLFTHIKRVDTVLILLNLLLLSIIVFVPVPTALLSQYFGYSGERTAALLYCGTSFAMACCFNFLWRYASYHNRLLGRHIDRESVAGISRQYLFGPLVYLITFGIAWLSPSISILLILATALFFALPGRAVLKKTTTDVLIAQEELEG